MVAPIPERDFLEFLAKKGCYGERTGGDEYGAYRISDRRLVSTYAVTHPGKREVKYPYKLRFLRALKVIQQEQEILSKEQVEGAAEENYKNAPWYKEQQQRESEGG